MQGKEFPNTSTGSFARSRGVAPMNEEEDQEDGHVAASRAELVAER